MNSFKYAAGLPGYGANGNDGSSGLAGFSIFVTDLLVEDGANLTITAKIERNEGLFSYDTSTIPGYPLRKYQNNDIFVDGNAKVYVIDLDDINKFTYSGVVFGSGEFLKRIITTNQIPGYTRYANVQMSERKLIDSVMGANSNYYSTPSSIYGIGPRDYAQINFVSSSLSGYNPYVVFNTSSSTQDDAIAIVRNTSSGMWRIGNLNVDNNYSRNTSMTFDFLRLLKNTGGREYDVLTKYEMDASVLFSPAFDTVPSAFVISQDGSTVSASWDNKRVLAVSNDDAVNANLVLFPIKTYSGQHMSHDVSSGELFDVVNKNRSREYSVIRINSLGSLNVTGLDPNVEYAAYIEYDMNGWVRRTSRRNSTSVFKYIKLEPDNISISSSGTNRSITVWSNVTWNILSRPTWVTATPSSGTNTTISISVEPQTSGSPARSGEIVLSGEGIRRVLKISQDELSQEISQSYDSDWQYMDRGTAASTSGFNVRIRRVGKLCIVQGTFVNGNMQTNSTIASIDYSKLYLPNEIITGPTQRVYFFIGPQVASNNDTNHGAFGYVPTASETDQTKLYVRVDSGSTQFGSKFNINFSFFIN